MKSKLILAGLCLGLLALQGCAGCANDMKRITLYGSNGVPIREWTTTTATRDQEGTCFFLTSEGREVTLSGTFVIEEIP